MTISTLNLRLAARRQQQIGSPRSLDMRCHMIEVHETASDDPEFLRLVAGVIDGLAERGAPRELHVIHIDNWLDHKWLGFSGKTLGALGVWKEGERLTVPAFTPNRVLSHQYFSRANDGVPFHESVPPKEIHLNVWSAVNLQRRLSEVVHDAAVVWHSSNTKTNRKGAIMAYMSNGLGYDTWYVSLAAEGTWRVEKTKEITRADFATLLRNVPLGDFQSGRSGAILRSPHTTGPYEGT